MDVALEVVNSTKLIRGGNKLMLPKWWFLDNGERMGYDEMHGEAHEILMV
jgi:hypothetical protein